MENSIIVTKHLKTLIDPTLQGIKNAIMGSLMDKTAVAAPDNVVVKQLEPDSKAPFTSLSIDQCLRKVEEKEKLSQIAADSAKTSKSNNNVQMAEEWKEIASSAAAASKLYRRLAAAKIYSLNNPNPKDLSKCVLRGLKRNEVRFYAQKHLESCKAAGIKQTDLVAGKGLFSKRTEQNLFINSGLMVIPVKLDEEVSSNCLAVFFDSGLEVE